MGRHADDCKNFENRYFRCWKIGHLIVDRKSNSLTCFNYGEAGHISTHYQKPKKVSSRGKVFPLTGSETTCANRLIRGTCFINSIPLIVIIGMGVTHSFNSLDYAKRLSLKLSSMVGSMVIDTSANGSVITSWVLVELSTDYLW